MFGALEYAIMIRSRSNSDRFDISCFRLSVMALSSSVGGLFGWCGKCMYMLVVIVFFWFIFWFGHF
jgi:hypothetical protein